MSIRCECGGIARYSGENDQLMYFKCGRCHGIITRKRNRQSTNIIVKRSFNRLGRHPFITLMIVCFLFYLVYNYAINKNIISKPDNNSPLYSYYHEDKNITLIESYIYEMTNTVRTSLGKHPLKRSLELDRLASYHSKNMALQGFFSHTDNEGLDSTGRAKKLGINTEIIKGNYIWEGIGENINNCPWYSNVEGCGDTTHNYEFANCTVESWKNSSGHYENMINEDYAEIGIGVYFNNDDGYSTQNFR